MTGFDMGLMAMQLNVARQAQLMTSYDPDQPRECNTALTDDARAHFREQEQERQRQQGVALPAPQIGRIGKAGPALATWSHTEEHCGRGPAWRAPGRVGAWRSAVVCRKIDSNFFWAGSKARDFQRDARDDAGREGDARLPRALESRGRSRIPLAAERFFRPTRPPLS